MYHSKYFYSCQGVRGVIVEKVNSFEKIEIMTWFMSEINTQTGLEIGGMLIPLVFLL